MFPSGKSLADCWVEGINELTYSNLPVVDDKNWESIDSFLDAKYGGNLWEYNDKIYLLLPGEKLVNNGSIGPSTIGIRTNALALDDDYKKLSIYCLGNYNIKNSNNERVTKENRILKVAEFNFKKGVLPDIRTRVAYAFMNSAQYFCVYEPAVTKNVVKVKKQSMKYIVRYCLTHVYI